MSEAELERMASTKRKGKPEHVSQGRLRRSTVRPAQTLRTPLPPSGRGDTRDRPGAAAGCGTTLREAAIAMSQRIRPACPRRVSRPRHDLARDRAACR